MLQFTQTPPKVESNCYDLITVNNLLPLSGRFLPQLDARTRSRLNLLLDGFTTYVNLALKPINVNPFSRPESKKALREKTRPKSLNLLSPFKYFLPELATLAITDP